MKNDKISEATVQHNIIQKPQAINDRTIKKQIGQIKPFIRKVGHNMDIARSKSISHFGSRPVLNPTSPNLAAKQFDIKPVRHPLATKVEKIRSNTKIISPQSQLQPQPIVNNPSKTTKETVIAEAFDKLNNNQKVAKKNLKRTHKFINISVISVILLVIIGCLIYFNMPVISVNIAGAQAGIKATYPEYCPDGYSLSGPVSYSDGQVTINFHANTGNKKFTIKQSRSSWDSSAVRNKVNTDSDDGFITTQENGLTIYSYNGNAIWVNGGILYTISGDAPLSSDQMRRIAASL